MRNFATFCLFAITAGAALSGIVLDEPIDLGPVDSCVWASLSAHKKDVCRALWESGLYKTNANVRSDAHSYICFDNRYKIRENPLKAIDLDTSAWPEGDYELSIRGMFKFEDGKRMVGSPFAFAIRRPVEREMRPAKAPSTRSGVLTIPLVRGFRGNPEGASGVDIPWQSGFSKIVGGAAPIAQTRFKAFHDGEWLYVAVACSEKERLADVFAQPTASHDSNAIYHRDAVEINIDPAGRGLSFRKIVVTARGDIADCLCQDDNTGNRTYTFSASHECHPVVKTVSGADMWGVEVAIPLEPLAASSGEGPWGLSIGRNRTVCHEMSAWPAGIKGFNLAMDFGKAELQDFDRNALQVEFSLSEAKTVRDGSGKLRLHAAATAVNLGNDFRCLFVKGYLTDSAGRLLCKKRTRLTGCSMKRRVLFPLDFDGLDGGRAQLHLEAYAPEGRLVREIVSDMLVDYSPVKIVFTEPCYRDAIFDSQKISSVAGYVALEEGVGQPLEITLTGAGTAERLSIPAAAATNRFAFPFAGKEKGTYVLQAGSAKKALRNLPPLPGEIWIDRDGVLHRDGKRFMPFGYFTDTFTEFYPGLTIAQTYAGFPTREKLVKYCRTCAEAGRGAVVPIWQRFGGTNEFSTRSMQGRLNDAQRSILAEMAETVKKDCPNFVAYYLCDEPSGRDLNPDWFRDVREFMAEHDPYHPTVILDYSISGTIRYADCADISCPDAYPVYCTDGTTRDPRRMTYDFARAARRSTTAWMCPQFFDWPCFANGKTACGPTYDDLRTQIMLSFAGDVKGFMCFTRWSEGAAFDEHLRQGPKWLLEEMMASQDVFLAPSIMNVRADSSGPRNTFIAAEKEYGGRRLMIACNTSDEPVTVSFSRVGLKAAHPNGASKPILTKDGAFTDTFARAETKVYYDRPTSFDLVAARKAVLDAEAARRVPGNLAGAKRTLLFGETRDWEEKKIVPDGTWYPLITASSYAWQRFHLYFPYFLQDGIKEKNAVIEWQGWMPERTDKDPWLKIDFGGKKRFSKVVLYRLFDRSGRTPVLGCTIEANGKTLATFADDGREPVVVIEFPGVEAQSLVIRDFKRNPKGVNAHWLSEVEVF